MQRHCETILRQINKRFGICVPGGQIGVKLEIKLLFFLVVSRVEGWGAQSSVAVEQV